MFLFTMCIFICERTSSSRHTLPRINSIQRPPSRNTVNKTEPKLTGRDISKSGVSLQTSFFWFEQTILFYINKKRSLCMICPGRRAADACGRIRVRSERVSSHQEWGRRGNTHEKGLPFYGFLFKQLPQKNNICHHLLYSPSCI